MIKSLWFIIFPVLLLIFQDEASASSRFTSCLTNIFNNFIFEKELTEVQKINLKLMNNKSFRLFKNHQEVELTSTSLSPGKSYTVVIYEDKLVLGEDYLNANGTTAATHVLLMMDLDAPFINSYRGKGGAIRVNINGSIDVSGYHLRGESTEAADLIKTKLEEALPGIHIRATKGRLNELKVYSPQILSTD